MNMERQILLPAPIRRELDATFKCGRNELSRALTYKRNTRRANMLRVAALERGGVIYTGAHAPAGYCPDVDTHHDHTTRMMYQKIGERVELQVSKDTNAASILIDGQHVASFNDMTIRSWGDVLYSLQQIYNQLNA
jgi:hypothetical protein